MKKQIFYLFASFILLLSFTCTDAAISDLYDFNISKPVINESMPAIVEPRVLQATYLFVDENNNSLYDYLIVGPQGSIRVYDAFDDLLIATENNKIDLKNFYAKKAEGPYGIVVDVNGSIYESTTGNETYMDFEKPTLPDLSVEIESGLIVVKNNGADTFNFFISIHEKDNQTAHQKIDYLKSGEEYNLNYPSTQDTRAFVDFENAVEESDEENNFAKSSSSAGTVEDSSISKSASSAAIFKNALKADASKTIDPVETPAQEENTADNQASDVSAQPESKKSNLLTGNVGLNIDSPPNKLASFIIIAASTFLLLYTYDFVFKKRRF